MKRKRTTYIQRDRQTKKDKVDTLVDQCGNKERERERQNIGRQMK